MDATLANDEFAVKLHRIPRYIDASDETALSVDAPAPRSLSRRIGDMFASFARYRANRALMAEMASMSDRELADIGLGRSDIERVFSKSFTQDNTIAKRAA